jgi:periplasmic protein TonB
MTPRMFQDLVMSSAVRPSRGRGRALPLSLAIHGAVFAAIAAVPLLRDPDMVEAAQPQWTEVLRIPPTAVVVQPPTAPPVHRPPTTRTATPAAPRAVQPSVTSGPAPALPTDISLLGTGTPEPDAPALCLHDCTPGAIVGATVGTGVGEGDGTGTGDPGPPRRAGVDVTPPARISGAQPVYPDLARHAGIAGKVVIECTIDPSGRVVNANVTRGIPLLNAAALEAVRTWRYRPTLVGGVPVAVLMTVTVSFSLR